MADITKIKHGSNVYNIKDARVDDLIEKVSLLDGLKYAKFTFPEHANASHTAGWYTICRLRSSLADGYWFTLGVRGAWKSTTPITAIFLCAIRLNNCQVKELVCPSTGDTITKIRIAIKDGVYYVEAYSPSISTGMFGNQYITLIGDFDLYEPEGYNRVMSLIPNTETVTTIGEVSVTANP